jgi:hypothetical protein
VYRRRDLVESPQDARGGRCSNLIVHASWNLTSCGFCTVLFHNIVDIREISDCLTTNKFSDFATISAAARSRSI